jgi:hypothetical protein
METVQEAVTERVAGDRPSRFKSFLASAAVGLAAATVTYRLLRHRTEQETA